MKKNFVIVFPMSALDKKHKNNISLLISEYLEKHLLHSDFYFDEDRFFCFHSQTEHIIMCYNEIVFFEKQFRKVLVHCTTGLYSFSGTLNQVLALVDTKHFIQVHHGFIVNKFKIKSLENLEIITSHNGIKVPVSKRRMKAVRDALTNIRK